MIRTPLPLLTVLLALAAIHAAAQEAGENTLARTPDELVRRAVAALNQRRPEAFKKLAAPGVESGWTDYPGPADPTNPWVGGTLVADGQTWVVFSIDKMVQMDHDHLYRAEPRDGGWRLVGNIDEAEPGKRWRIADHDLAASIDPGKRSVRITDTFEVRALTASSPLVFDLGHLYRIHSLTVGGAPAAYRRAGNLVEVEAPAATGDSVRVAYDRTFDQPPGLRSNVTNKDALLYADWLPVIAYQPAPARITLETPAAWESLAQGDLTATRRGAGTVTRIFDNRRPVSFIMAAAGSYSVARGAVAGVPLATYMLKADPQRSQRGLRMLSDALPFYTARFGPMPWKQYTLVETSALQGLAQEGYSYSVYSSSLFPGVAAHELAHSWWGGKVNNTYFRSYWNESLTTFTTDLLNESRLGAETGHVRRLAALRRYRATVLTGHDIPLMDATTVPWGLLTIGTTYEKGTVVCRMLQRELGDALFFRVLRRFLTRYSGKAADWDDLARVASAEAGRPMGWFFEQWTRRPGGLQLRWSGVKTRSLPGGRTEIDAVLEQKEPLFEAHVDVLAGSTAGVTRATVHCREARTSVRLTVDGTPKRLVADPGDDLVRALTADELPVNTETFFYDHAPLLVVYGTKGTPEYRRAMRKQAEEQAAFWQEQLGFYDLASVKAVADTAVTKADRRRAHFILTGRPGANALLDEVLGKLPVRWTGPDRISLGGRSCAGPGVVVVTNTRSPWNRSRMLRTWQATGARGMGQDWDENGGGTQGWMSTAWAARDGRVLAWTDSGVADQRTYVFPASR